MKRLAVLVLVSSVCAFAQEPETEEIIEVDAGTVEVQEVAPEPASAPEPSPEPQKTRADEPVAEAPRDEFEFSGAITAFAIPQSLRDNFTVAWGEHWRPGFRFASGIFFSEVRASLLLSLRWTGTMVDTSNLLEDLGSHVAVGLRPGGFVEELRLTLFPYNSVTALPVFDWANRYGVVPAAFAPAASLSLSTKVGSAFVTTRVQHRQGSLGSSPELRPELFGGVSAALPAGLALDGRVAWLQYRMVEGASAPGAGLPQFAIIVSGRLAWTLNEPVGPAMDFALYETDPRRFERFFVTEPRRTSLALTLTAEGGGGVQHLRNLSTQEDMLDRPLGWGEVQVRLRVQALRLFATGRIHSATFVQADNENMRTFPLEMAGADTTTEPHLAALAGADVTWRAAKLTPGVLFNLSRPASLRRVFDFGGANPLPGLAGPRVLLMYRDRLVPLPGDYAGAPVLGAKFSLKWEPVGFLLVAGEVNLEHDWNYTMEWPDSTTLREGTFNARAQVLLQLRWN